MKHYSYGDTIRCRVKLLFEVLLSYAYDQLEGTEQLHSNLKINFDKEDKKLVIRTKLRVLQELIILAGKDKTSGQLTKEQIREAIKYLENYLGILRDDRESPRGSEDWHFTLNIWEKDMFSNLKRFDSEWKAKLPLKAKLLSQSEKRGSTSQEETETRPSVGEADGVVRQVMASGIAVSGDLEAEDMAQVSRGSSVEQEMLTGVEAQNIRLCKLSQESY